VATKEEIIMDDIDRMTEDELRNEVHRVHGWSSKRDTRVGGETYCHVFDPILPRPDAPRWEACGKDAHGAYAKALRELRDGLHKLSS
jgi:hypothetical protein